MVLVYLRAHEGGRIVADYDLVHFEVTYRVKSLNGVLLSR